MLQAKEKMKYLKLDDNQWEQVRAFVKEFFEQPEKAAKTTYKTLFGELGRELPD